MVQKTVITVKVDENTGKQRGDGPPSDRWSWRKYGQKPIKGSPYPRGYYRCSTSKGCSAKKQVQRCRTDPSKLIITYTSVHNHPGLDVHVQSATVEDVHNQDSSEPATAKREPDNCDNTEVELPSPNSSKDDRPQTEQAAKNGHDQASALFGEDGALPHPQAMASSTTQQPSCEVSDFFDELEELPISTSFTSLMRSSFFDERILLPS